MTMRWVTTWEPFKPFSPTAWQDNENQDPFTEHHTTEDLNDNAMGDHLGTFFYCF